jgi:adenine phosphoribosyltransferase
MSSLEALKKAVRDVPDFPKPGILFKDITPVLGDPALFRAAVDLFVARHAQAGIQKVACIDARGFLFGSAVAYALKAGLVPIRKKGKLPYKTIDQAYALEYGTAEIAMHVDAVKPGEKVLLIDDLLATGGTALAAVELLEKSGARVVEIDFLIELEFLKGREKLAPRPVFAAVAY